MISLSGLIGTLLLALWLGKRTREPHLGTFLLIAILALLQVIIVLYDMFTMAKPALPNM